MLQQKRVPFLFPENNSECNFARLSDFRVAALTQSIFSLFINFYFWSYGSQQQNSEFFECNGVRTKWMKWMMIYSGTTDILYPKIDTDLHSRLATVVSAGVHHLAMASLDCVTSSWGQWFLFAPIRTEMEH